MRLLAVVEYDGTDFAGFQLQDHDGVSTRTVQAELEQAVAPLAGQGTRIAGAGRTDSGVHAAGQVVHLDTEACLARDLPRFLRAWNARLPDDIRVHEVRPVPGHVHARYSAISRTYCYRIVNAPICPPLLRRYSHHVRAPLALAAMSEGARHLVGRHDFAPFAAREGPGSTRREVLRVRVTEQWAVRPLIWHTFPQSVVEAPSRLYGPAGSTDAPGLVEGTRVVAVEIEANAFLRHMMRRIVGTLVEVGQGSLSTGEVAAILAGGEKHRAGQSAPARGLCLQHVRYDLDAYDQDTADAGSQGTESE